MQIREEAAIIIQAYFRGYIARKAHSNARFEMARRRLGEQMKVANSEPSRLLGHRTLMALDKLQKFTALSKLSREIQSLEVTTRMSPESCLTIAESNAISILARVMKDCNRSPHSIDIVCLSLSVLVNMAKYEKTTPYVLQGGQGLIAVLIEKLKNHIKDEKLVPLVITLLYICLAAQNDWLNVKERSTLMLLLEKMKAEPQLKSKGKLTRNNTFTSRPVFKAWFNSKQSDKEQFQTRHEGARILADFLVKANK